MDTAKARALVAELREELEEAQPELCRLQAEVERLHRLQGDVERKQRLLDALVPFAEEEDDEGDDARSSRASSRVVSPRTEPRIRVKKPGTRRVIVRRGPGQGKTASLIESVLRDLGKPMSPSEVVDTLEHRGQLPDSEDPAALVGTTLQRLHGREYSPVRRIEAGQYVYDVEASGEGSGATQHELSAEEVSHEKKT